MFAGRELYPSDKGVRKAFTCLSCAFDKKVGLPAAKIDFVEKIMNMVSDDPEFFGDKELIVKDYLIKAAFNDYFELEAKAKKECEEGHGRMYYKDLVEMGRETFLQALSQAMEDGVGFGVVRRPEKKRNAGVVTPVPVGTFASEETYASLHAGKDIQIVQARLFWDSEEQEKPTPKKARSQARKST